MGGGSGALACRPSAMSLDQTAPDKHFEGSMSTPDCLARTCLTCAQSCANSSNNSDSRVIVLQRQTGPVKASPACDLRSASNGPSGAHARLMQLFRIDIPWKVAAQLRRYRLAECPRQPH